MKSILTFADLAADAPTQKTGPVLAYCMSEACTRYPVETTAGSGKKITQYKFHPYVEKAVKKTTIDCPQCGHALWWGRNPDEIAS